MNLLHILARLSEADPDALDRLDSRRAVFGSLAEAAKRTTLASAPALLAAYFSKAYAGTAADPTPVQVFNDALALELLEADFYTKMIDAPTFTAVSAADKLAIRQIAKHETAHVALLQKVVQGLNGTPATGGFKASEFAALPTFAAQLEMAQLLEDTGVRACKGSAGFLAGLSDSAISGVGTINLLQTALQIHSVEARHAAHIRTMRGQTPWVSGSGDLDQRANYRGATPETNLVQAGLTLTTQLAAPYTAADVQAAFDEPLTREEVTNLVAPLIGV